MKKTTPNQDLASLAVPSISPSCRRGSVLRSQVSTSTESGEYQRNEKKRRIQRRLSRGYAFPEMFLHSPMDPISPNSMSCTGVYAIIKQADIQGAPRLVASSTSASGQTGDTSNTSEPPDPDFSSVFSHILRGYNPTAPHFDGLDGARNEDYLIDLDTDSMERLPDVRAYLFCVGYYAVHELRRDESVDPLDREQEYVRAGRLALKAERDTGRRGLFLAPLDWMAMRENEDEPSHWQDQDEPCAWMGHVIELLNGSPEEAAAFGHSGAWDPAFTHEDWRIPNGHYPATNVRAPLFPKKHMLIGPGHPDWTSLVVDLYLRHPLANLGYTTVERYSFILAGSSKQHEWYTREIIQFYNHYGGINRHDLEGCVYCDERDFS